ncbi:MAG: hypothetical protein AAFX94_10080 [Myxococcota bacterium]
MLRAPLTALVALGVTALPDATARAAELTEVADALDVEEIGTVKREDPFDFNFGVGFHSDRESGKITREPFERSGVTTECTEQTPFRCVPVDELDYRRTTNRLRLDAEFGIFRDLSFTLGWTYVLGQNLSFNYADGVDAANSSIDPQTGDPNDTLFPNDFESVNRGSGPLELTLKWAPLSDQRDVTRPTWLLFFTWSNPWTTSVFDPADGATDANPGPVGDGVHRLTFGTAFSKRMGNFGRDIEIDPSANRRGFFDPYFSASFTLPLPEDGLALDDIVSNRDNPFGKAPSSEFNVKLGFEIVPIENIQAQRKFAIDLGLDTSYFTEGRNYSLLTNPLGELTFEEQHARVMGHLGFYVQAAEFLKVQGTFRVGFGTEHFLTFEDAGDDIDGDGQVLEGTDDAQNPFFCSVNPNDICASKGQPSVDQVGFRLKDEEHLVLSWSLRLIMTF